MRNIKLHTSSGGYVALASVLVIAAIVVSIGLSTSLLSINEAQNSLASKKSEETLDLVEACAEEALIKLSRDANVPSTITLPEGTCNVTENSQVGSNWDVTIEHTFEKYTKRVRLDVDRSTTITINGWNEVE